jgi:hypothetical protein
MTKPIRIQRSRVAGWRMPPHTKSVTRPHKFGNPYKIVEMDGAFFIMRDDMTICVCDTKEEAQIQAVNCFCDYLDYMQPSDLDELLAELRGWNLACYCPIGTACHGDVWLERANEESGS